VPETAAVPPTAAGPTTGRPSLDALLPLKISGRHYGENLARLDILLSSLEHFAEPGLLGELLVVVRDDEADAISRHLEQWRSLPIRLVREDRVLPEFRRFSKPWQIRPWQRQQIIKLCAPALTTSDFVLVIDPDVLAVKPLSSEILLHQGRALLEPEPRSVHRQWWLDSADLLGAPANLDRPGMNVTPALLSTEIVAEVQRRLEAVSGRPWVETLLTSYCDWTEYTLYLLAAESAGLLATHHIWADDPAAPAHIHIDPELNVWDAGNASRASIDRFFTAGDPGLFAVVQSNTGFAAADVAAAVADRFPVRMRNKTPIPVGSRRLKLAERAATASRLAAQRIYRARRRRARCTGS
jgi:Family of unknown function (DUF6492)